MWYILNYIPTRGHRRDALPAVVASFNRAYSKEHGLGDTCEAVECFAPTFVQLKEEAGHMKKADKPLLYHYIFIRGEENAVKQLCYQSEGFSFVIDRAGKGRYLTISDEKLEQFKLIASFYAGKLPCYPIEGTDLEEGDRVQVASGPFSGLTGTYISRKGGKSGNILVSVDGSMAAIVYDVKAEYVRVLEFARDSKRAYDQLDAFADKIKPVLGSRETPDIRLISVASIFTRRLGIVKLHNPKLDAKLQILLFAAYSILSDSSNARESLEKFRELESHVTNPKTLELCASIIERFKAPTPQ